MKIVKHEKCDKPWPCAECDASPWCNLKLSVPDDADWVRAERNGDSLPPRLRQGFLALLARAAQMFSND